MLCYRRAGLGAEAGDDAASVEEYRRRVANATSAANPMPRAGLDSDCGAEHIGEDRAAASYERTFSAMLSARGQTQREARRRPRTRARVHRADRGFHVAENRRSRASPTGTVRGCHRRRTRTWQQPRQPPQYPTSLTLERKECRTCSLRELTDALIAARRNVRLI
jgi:hypothetical protein